MGANYKLLDNIQTSMISKAISKELVEKSRDLIAQSADIRVISNDIRVKSTNIRFKSTDIRVKSATLKKEFKNVYHKLHGSP